MDIISRAEAKRLGLKKYYTGMVCVNGHVAERLVSNWCCVDCNNTNLNAWKADNPEKSEQIQRKWLEKNPGYHAAKSREYYKTNVEKRAEQQKEWCNANREKKRSYTRNYQARREGNGGSHTAEDIERIFKEQDGKCAYYFYCETVLTPDNQSVDHIIPLIKGGSNGPENLQLTCQHCNKRKNDKDPDVFLRELIAEVIQRKMGQAAE